MADQDADLLAKLDGLEDLHRCQCGRLYSAHDFRKADPCGALRSAERARVDAWWDREFAVGGLIIGVAVLFVLATYALAQMGAPMSVWLWSLL